MVDVARIEELTEEIGDEAVSAVLMLFLEEARATIDRIATSLSEAEHAAAIHFLRSGALNLGLVSLAGAAAAAAFAPPLERAHSAREMRRILDRSATLLGLPEAEAVAS
jgi:HPt (histidine-containing phosphotransfer) domain-containing protein